MITRRGVKEFTICAAFIAALILFFAGIGRTVVATGELAVALGGMLN